MVTKKAARKRPFSHVDKVDVYLWDTLIGAVALDPIYNYYK